MNITEVYAEDDNDAKKQLANIDSIKRNTESSGRKYVNVLLDLSEEDYCREHNMHLLQSRTGWEDAVEGWGRFPPFAVPQRNGKNKQDIIDSHCLLCADLKLSDLDAPTPLGLAKETQNSFSSTSSDELYAFNLKNTPGPLINKLVSGDKQCTQKKSPSVCHYHTEPCQMLKEKTVALSIRSFGVLPPVKESKNVFKRVQLTDWQSAEEVKLTMPSNTSAVTVIGETGNDIKALTDFIPGENSYRFKGSPGTKHLLSQDNTQLPSTFNISFQNKYEIPSSTVANTLPQFSYPLGRNLRQEEMTKPATRNNTSFRLYSGHKARDLKRPEAHRLMLIGTRVHMPL